MGTHTPNEVRISFEGVPWTTVVHDLVKWHAAIIFICNNFIMLPWPYCRVSFQRPWHKWIAFRDAYCYIFFDIDTDTNTRFWYRYQIHPYHDIHRNLFVREKLLLTGKQRHAIRSTTHHLLPLPVQWWCAVVTTMATSTELVNTMFICEMSSLYWIYWSFMVRRAIFSDASIYKNVVLSPSFRYLGPIECGTGPRIVLCTSMYP